MAKAKRYELDDSVLGESNFKGQAALIVRSLLDKHPQTAQEIADDIKSRLTTRQDPLRVVSFYLSTWKKSGLITVAADDAPVSGGTSNEAPVVPDNVDEEVAERDIAELEDEADAVDETLGFDFVNAPLAEAVTVVLRDRFADPASPKMISDELNVLGRTVTPKQVSDKIRNLLDKRVITKVGDGRYSLPT